jgi:hypothetical protein
MGKTSVSLNDELTAGWKASGVSLSELVRRGLAAGDADELRRELAALRSELYFLRGQVAGYETAATGKPPAQPEGFLEWHEGRHPWDEHDGYRRHQHSLNGALTIDPKDTRAHFSSGPGFDNPGPGRQDDPALPDRDKTQPVQPR